MKIKEKYDSLDIRTKAWLLTMSFILFVVMVVALVLQFPLFFAVVVSLFVIGISVWGIYLGIVEMLYDREKRKR
jgi:hypothetical protein